MVDLELFGGLAPAAPRRQAVPLPHPMPVAGLVALLGIDPADVGIVIINGMQSDLADLVPDGARVCLFTPLSGG